MTHSFQPPKSWKAKKNRRIQSMAIGVLFVLILIVLISPKIIAGVQAMLPGASQLLSRAVEASIPQSASAQVAQAPAPVLTTSRAPTGETIMGVAQETFFDVWSVVVPLSVFVSLLFLMGAVYAFIRLRQVKIASKEKYHVKDHPTPQGPVVTRAQLRWESIVLHSQSANENDWRQAIMEADIMLAELLEVQGYRGDTIGDKMKQIEKSDFNTIEMAWEAHKIRNKVAHEGSAHSLNTREVRRVIGLYEQVFKEFHFI